MISPVDSPTAPVESRALLFLLVVVTVAFGWILAPFFGTIMWAAIIAMLFAPVYRRLLPRLRQRRTAAALVTLLVVLLIVILPFALITAALAREAATLYQQIQSGELNPAVYFSGVFDALPDWITALLDRFGLIDFATLQNRLAAGLAQGSQFIAAQALSIGQNSFEFIASLFIAMYLAFYLIRDGESVARTVRRAIPLAPEHKQELLVKFATVIRATVKGNLLVAAIQGALGGIAFWFLGVTGALLWGVLMAFLSLLPAVGAALVWVPVALYFLVTGALVKGIALIAWGVLVIGLIDNLLRPILVGKDTRMPDYVVMIATLGGMAVFGINGFVIGPTIAAMFIAVWHIHGAERTGGTG
ncbi:MAG: AI-2E family transporter [Betaproteobacteria bacterium]|nr:AI-2E family transporter [Betaproteobacteria bacterium]